MGRMKPGLGWRLAGGAVFDHASGTRVHVMGLCKLPGGEIVNGMLYPESSNLERLVRINGGNRKRGAMVWARGKYERLTTPQSAQREETT